MPSWKLWLCRLILKLDRIPRYGRLYIWKRERQGWSQPIWKYQKRGMWGFYLLDNIGWLHDYMDETIDWSEVPNLRFRTPGLKVYRIYKAPNWRQLLKARRRQGVWPKAAKTPWRFSRTRWIDETPLDRAGR